MNEPTSAAPLHEPPLTERPSAEQRAEAARGIRHFLDALGLAPQSMRETAETPQRVVDAFFDELLQGHWMNPSEILAPTIAASNQDPLLLVNVPVVIMCPHHLMPGMGFADVGYVPKNKLVGLGALQQLLHCHTRRLTLQENIARAVVHDIDAHLGASAALCQLRITHSCFNARGERPHGAQLWSEAACGDGALQAQLRQLSARTRRDAQASPETIVTTSRDAAFPDPQSPPGAQSPEAEPPEANTPG